MAPGAPEVSHGRGGAGNINPDDTKYVDGEVTRVGAEGSHGDGAFSTGRGGKRSFSFSYFLLTVSPQTERMQRSRTMKSSAITNLAFAHQIVTTFQPSYRDIPTLPTISCQGSGSDKAS